MNNNTETEFIEFKESLSQLSRAAESIVAMLNKHGKAEIVFGIKDDGVVVGVSIGNKTLRDISTLLIQKVKPSVIPTITMEDVDGKTIVKVKVVAHNKPYSADGNYLIRSGNENKKIDPSIMKELLFSNSYDLMTDIESFDQDLSFNQLKQLFILRDYSINDHSFSKNNGLLTKNGKYNLLANILSDNNNVSIKVVRFAGVDKSEMIFRNEYGYKCLILSLQSALEYVLSLNETKVELNGNAIRKEICLFDENSLREAWSNACLHTRWDKMVPPAIYIFNNRIEIVSTGGLPIDYSVDDFYSGISNPINKQLQKIMGQLGIVEQTGHGVLQILKHYGKEAFSITDNHIVVTLNFPFELSNHRLDYSSLTLSQQKVLKAISVKPNITTDELVKVVNLSTSRIAIIIRELKELHRIERIGSNKTGYWNIVK